MASMTSQPYVIAAIISAVPATIAAASAWYGTHKGRHENRDDHANVVSHIQALDTKVQKIDIKISQMDLRFDTIEDKVERHLGWHRDEAADKLEQTIKKETKSDNPTNQLPVVRPQD